MPRQSRPSVPSVVPSVGQYGVGPFCSNAAVLQSVPSTPPSVPRTNGAVTTWLMAEHHATPWDGGWLIWDVLSTTHLGYDTHTGPYDESHLRPHLRLDAVAHAAASRPPGRDSRPGLAAGPAARAPVRPHIGLSQSNVVHGQGHLALVHHYTPLTAWHPSWLPDTPPVLLS